MMPLSLTANGATLSLDPRGGFRLSRGGDALLHLNGAFIEALGVRYRPATADGLPGTLENDANL